MKRKILALFIGLSIICLVLTCSIVGYTNKTIHTGSRGLERVNRNDILKNAQSLLEGGQDKALASSLNENGIDLVLYDIDGGIMYDSRGNAKTIQNEDINKIIEESGGTKQVFIINYTVDHNKQLAVAILEEKEKQPGIEEQKRKVTVAIWAIYAVFTLLLALLFIIVYRYVLHPFNKLEHFASEVAKGNLETSMVYPRQNIFGAFTWAFDMLRNELKTSKERKEEAERIKKELVAVLSHDILTPIASIKAYAECMGDLPDKNSERSERYLGVIVKKADELAKLSQDMFIHAISDLEKLEITPRAYQSRELLNNILEPMILQYENRIVITSAIPDVSVYTDEARLAQVCENILSNAVKYAPGSEIRIEAAICKDMLICKFKDNGEGVNPEDLPFLFDKFYRGKNAKESGQPGSGLGLYICSHILGKMGGSIKAINFYETGISGFVVEIALKII